MRHEKDPVGLKNVGNTCYFNCLIQAYFYLPSFTQKILKSQKSLQSANEGLNPIKPDQNKARVISSRNLVESLGKLFAQMILANRKYVDPTSVLKSVTDDFGNPVQIGE